VSSLHASRQPSETSSLQQKSAPTNKARVATTTRSACGFPETMPRHDPFDRPTDDRAPVEDLWVQTVVRQPACSSYENPGTQCLLLIHQAASKYSNNISPIIVLYRKVAPSSSTMKPWSFSRRNSGREPEKCTSKFLQHWISVWIRFAD